MNKKLKFSYAVTPLILSLSITSPVYAQSVASLSYNGRAMFEVSFFDKGEKSDFMEKESAFTLSDLQKSEILNSLDYWNSILGPYARNLQPVNIHVGTEFEQNAFASSAYYSGNSNNGAYSVEELIIRNGPYDPVKTNTSVISVGKYLGSSVNENSPGGWYVNSYSPICENESSAEYVSTFIHEFGHALGICCVSEIMEIDPDVYDLFPNIKINGEGDAFAYDRVPSQDGTQDKYFIVSYFPEYETTGDHFREHLYDIYGNKARAGMPIITQRIFDYISEHSEEPVDRNDFFIVDEMSRNANQFPNQYGSAFFKGEHISEALNGALIDGVDGVPINGWEEQPELKQYFPSLEGDNYVIFSPELSHLQTKGMMSHVSYTNYTTFIEVELALMQDLGYKIDRRNFFGFSEYGSDKNYVNTHGYFARNIDGTEYVAGKPNYTNLGVGFHIYGDHNSIVQNADLLAYGKGAVGIRVDGTENKITVNNGVNVRADGYKGTGILVSAGSKHNITVNGTVTATGENGNALRFDYGSSSNGATDEYRGSYIDYHRYFVSDTDGSIAFYPDFSEANLSIANSENPDVNNLNGELVREALIQGNVYGSQNAVYIGKNAFVKKIKIGDGAQVTGNISSDWKHFDDEAYKDLCIQYHSRYYEYDSYIPDLVTDLNFSGKDSVFAGNIEGSSNIRMSVTSGNTSVNGTANIVSVNVSEGATLSGNATYKLADREYLDDNLALGFDLSDEGTFTNNGTVKPGNSIGQITINGDYEQGESGSLVIEYDAAGNADKLVVKGNSRLDGSVRLQPYGTGYFANGIKKYALSDFIKSDSYSVNSDFSIEPEEFSDSPTLKQNISVRGSGENTEIGIETSRNYLQYAHDRNSAAVASALSKGSTFASSDMAGMYSAIDFSDMSGLTVRQALTQLKPSVYANSAVNSFDFYHMVNSMLSDSLRRSYMSGDGSLLYARPFAGNYSRGTAEDGFNGSQGGVSFGFDKTADSVSYGVYAVAKHENIKTDNSSQASGNGLSAGLHSLFNFDSGFSLYAGAGIGFENYTVKRNFNFNNYAGRTRSTYTALTGDLYTALSYEVKTDVVNFAPFVSLDNVYYRLPSLTEESLSGASVSVDSKVLSSLKAKVGSRFTNSSSLIKNGDLRLTGQIAYGRELLSDGGSFNARFVQNSNASFSYKTEYSGRNSFDIGAGLIYKQNNALEIGFDAGVTLFDKSNGHISFAKADLIYRF